MKSLQTIHLIMRNRVIAITDNDPFNINYEGFNFQCDSLHYKVRSAKKTSKKAGYFTVAWVKNDLGANVPYSEADFTDFLIVLIDDDNKKGLFLFPKLVLTQKGILSSEIHSSKGKMGFRVYTPWDFDLNPTAQQSFKWQRDYFYEIDELTEWMF